MFVGFSLLASFCELAGTGNSTITILVMISQSKIEPPKYMTWQWVDVTKMRDLQNKTEQTNRNFENSFKSKIENSKIESQKQLREKIETSKRT